MEVLKHSCIKYSTKLNFVNEYKTSMTCHNCLKENRTLGSSKEFDCNNCKIKLDRDINAAINIFINRKL